MPNSTTKMVGEHQGKGVENLIDKNDLKVSHLPFNKTAISAGQDPRAHSHSYSCPTSAARLIKQRSEQAKVPFSPMCRVRTDENTHYRVNSVQQDTFVWKAPTVYK